MYQNEKSIESLRGETNLESSKDHDEKRVHQVNE